MARQLIDIGIEGNDGTGDSVRESFRKTNENFREIYAVVGLGGQITFTSLGDTPDSYEEYVGNNQAAYIPIVKQDGTGIEIRKIVSDASSADANQDTVDTVGIDVTEEGFIILRAQNVKVSQDQTPSLSGPLNASGQAIGNVGVNQDAVDDYNSIHSPQITIDDLVVDKKYTDENYIQRQKPGNRARMRDEPVSNADYILTVAFNNGLIQLDDHGLDASTNGSAWTYNSNGTDAAPLVSGTTYYLRVRNQDQLEIYASESDSLIDDATTREAARISAATGSGIQTFTDNDYNSDLYGRWLETEALPRKSVVRRQGDDMEGALYLHDHPGELAGQGTPNGITDLQAATKYYVDSANTVSSTNIFVSTQGNDDQSLTPAGREGRSLSYAYRTIGAAARKAEELQIASKFETGPYRQTITYTDANDSIVKNSYVTGAGIDSPDSDDLITRALVDDNIDFIVAEVLAWIDYNVDNQETTVYNGENIDWTEYFYDASELEKDLYKIVRSVVLDHVAGIRANVLSRRAGIEYYADQKTKNDKGLTKFEYLAAIDRAKLITDYVLRNDNTDPYIDSRTGSANQTIYAQVYNLASAGILPNQQDEDSVEENFNIVLDIVENGVFAAPKIVDGQRYEVKLFNGGQGYVDQGNPLNSDIRVGKLIIGKVSGAVGRITKYNYEDDPNTITDTNTDSVFLELLEPTEFIDGEELEFGNLVRENQVTIRVETGIYEEDYPIRIPNNTSLKGDEFRRVIIRPKNRTSLSPWANVYFYRDEEFDGLTGNTNSVTGYPDTNLPHDGTPYINPLTSEQDGYFGRHYLFDPNKDINIDDNGQITVVNPGAFVNASRLIEKNKLFLQTEAVEWAKDQIANSVGIWNGFVIDESRYLSDAGKIVDGIIADLTTGGHDETLALQGLFYPNLTTGQEQQLTAFVEKIREYLNAVIDNTLITSLSTLTQYVNANLVSETNADTTIDQLFVLLQFAFDLDFNPAKNNTQLDAFMMNDATIMRNVTVQGHGGFMCVLDPEGQILTKSPYIQTGSSFSQSVNRQAFRGGMLVDAFCGNTPLTVTNVVSPFELEVEGAPGSGLFIRKPQVPAPFYIDGIRYQVNDIIDYDPKDGLVSPTATLVLDPNSGPLDVNSEPVGFIDTSYPAPYDITLQTAGNRSMLGNDFTQINDLGYGLLVMNGGLSEMVSMFTYYCHAAYYSYNGSQIRSVAGSNANGNFGLVAEGADPNEVPDDVTLLNDMVQSAKAFSIDGIVDVTGVISATAGDAVTQPTSDFSADVAFTTIGRKVYLNNVSGTLNLTEELEFEGTGAGANSIPVSIDTGFTNEVEQLSLHFYDTEHVPTNKGEMDVIHNISGSDTIARYEIANISKLEGILVDGYEIDDSLYTTASAGGINALFVIEKTIQDGYTAKIVEAGSGWAVSDTIDIDGTELGGVTSTNDATITVTAVNTDPDLGALGKILSVSISGTINQLPHTPVRRGQVFRANMSTGNTGFSNDGLLAEVLQDEYINVRSTQNFIFDGAISPATLNIRPSTAVNFQEDPDNTYRSISFGTADAAGNDLDTDEVYTGFDATYDYARLLVNDTYSTQSDITGSGTTMGATIGDDVIAINTITEEKDKRRLNNNSLTPTAGRPTDYTGELPMVITWGGKKHTVSNYREVITASAPSNILSASQTSPVLITTTTTTAITTGQEVDIASVVGMTELNGNTYYAKIVTTTSFELYSDSDLTTPVDGTGFTAYASGGTATGNETITYLFRSDANPYALVDIADVAGSDITGGSTVGINSPMYILGESTTLRAGLQSGAPATITVNISTCRATGHDFLDIGTGSFNQTNYPNVILGFPAKGADQDSEVQERNKGRVFYVSTDQDGFFRVGRFFTVDQGTGTVTFSASIALSDVDGIGFKRGVVVTEFSTDSAMSDNAIDTVPVESAVRAYVNRRLGYDHAGIPVSNPIGPSVLVQNGSVPMTGDLNMQGNYIQNLANIDLDSDPQVAVNKAYVDSRAEAFNKFALMRDVSVYNGGANQLLALSGAKTFLVDAESITGGDFEIGNALENQTGTTTFGTVNGVFQRYDSVYGNVVEIAYTETNPGITVGGDIYTNTGVSGEVLDGIYDEVINVSEDAASDIGVSIVRSNNNNGEDPNVDPDFPTASVDLQINPGVIENADIAADAGIVQSKLDMEFAGTAASAPSVGDDDATVQAALGLVSFDSSIFEVTRGWTTIAANGIALNKIQQISSDTVLGNSTGSTSNVSEVTFNTIVDEAGGIFHTDIPGADTGAIIRTGSEAYDVELITTTGTADSLVKTEANGEVTVNSLRLGQNNTYTVLQLDGTGGTRLKVTTPVGGTVLTAQGGSASIDPDVFIPGNLNIGNLTDPDGADAGTEPDVFDTSTLQDNSTSFSTSSWIASEWAYHGFIEAPNEKGAASAGIALGAGSGKAATGEVAIVVANTGNSTSPVVATFSSTGIVPDTNGAYNIGTESARYGEVYAERVDTQSITHINGSFTTTVQFDGATGANKVLEFPDKNGTLATLDDVSGAAGGVTRTLDQVTDAGNTTTNDISVGAVTATSFSGDGASITNVDAETLDGINSTGFLRSDTDDTFTGTLTMSGNILPNSTASNRNLGSSSQVFNTVYATTFEGTSTQAQYADLAENYLGDADYEPGTVLVLGGTAEVTVTNIKGDHRVAGIVTTNPAHLMNSTLEGDHVVGVALKGRVPCNVIGKVSKGDMLVASAIPGYAIVNNSPSVGTVIGKAITEKTDADRGTVEVLVGRT